MKESTILWTFSVSARETLPWSGPFLFWDPELQTHIRMRCGVSVNCFSNLTR